MRTTMMATTWRLYILGIAGAFTSGLMLGISIPVANPFMFGLGAGCLYIALYGLIRAATER